MARDLYEALGVAQGSLRGGDQEGLPQARPRLPPRSQPRRPRGGGPLQGGPGRLRHALGPREAQAIRRGRDVRRPRRVRRPRPGAGRLRLRHRRHLLHALQPPRRAGASEQIRGRDLETEVTLGFDQAMQGPRSRSRSPSRRPARPAAAPARSPGPRRSTCPRCGGRGVDSAEPGLLLDQPAVPAVRRPRPGDRGRPARPAAGSGLTLQRKRYRVRIPAGVRDGTRIRVAGKGEDGPLGGPPGDLYVVTRVAPSPVFNQRADGNLEVHGADHRRRGDPGRHRRGPDAERDQADPRPGRDRSTAPSSGCAARARRRPAGAGAATSTTGSRSRSRATSPTSSGSALDAFAEAMNDHDPRERTPAGCVRAVARR